MLRFALAALLLALHAWPFYAHADIINGNFSSGSASWTWTQATIQGDSAANCAAALAPFTVRLRYDVPTDYYFAGNDPVARVTGDIRQVSGVDIHTFCRQIEQPVYVPPGSVLKFDRSISAGTLFSGQHAETVHLEVFGRDQALSSERRVFAADGNDYVCGPLQSNCRVFVPSVADISTFWGKSVLLRVRANQKWVATSPAAVTQAFVDNFRFEQIAVSPSPFKSGSWFNPNRSGHGIHLSRAGNGNFVLIWYTYLADGRSVWYISDTKPAVNGVWQGTLYKSNWNSTLGTNSLLPAGDIKIEMTGPKAMTFYWDLYSVNGNNTGFDGAEPFVFLSGGGSYTGLWYEPSYSGWGLSLEYLDNPAGIDTVATAFYYAGSEPVWAQGAIEGTPTGNKIVQLTEYTGIGLCPECVGQETRMFPWPAGMLSLDLDAQRGWIEAQSHSGATWNRGSAALPAEIVRMTGP